MFAQHNQTTATHRPDLTKAVKEGKHHRPLLADGAQTGARLEHRGRILYYTTTAHTEEQTNTAPAVAVLRLTAYNVPGRRHGKGIPR